MKDAENDPYYELRKKLLGLGDSSFRKTYYPVLRHKQMELERFRIILDHINDIVFLISYPDGIIVDYNLRAIEKLGLKPHEVISREISAFLFDDLGKPVSLKAMKDKGERILIRAEIACRSCGKMPVEADLSFTKYGDEIYCAIVCRDITERIQMERLILDSESQYRTTIEAITDGILVINSSGRSIIYNEAFRDMYIRFTGEEIPEKIDVSDFFKQTGLSESGDIHALMDSMDSGEIIGKVLLDDKMAVIEIKKIPIIHEFRHEQSVLIIRDITLNSVLDELRKDVLYQLNRNMEQFAILNDEIRNPLQALSGTVELKNPALAGEIQPFINEINMIVRRLDIGWLESEKVRSMIKRHYGVSVLEKDEIRDAVHYIREFRLGDENTINP
ncbi:MAG: PAS domain S-box protein [Methanomicrobiaceae archaeon]|nr:PAS domain S-box protein [Methanomicrobiaceae archaeon]